MYNYTITRISPWHLFCHMLIAGIVIGGIVGIILGLMEHETLGFTGGAFIGLTLGLMAGGTSVMFALVFNALAPIWVGIPVSITEVKQPSKAAEPKEQA